MSLSYAKKVINSLKKAGAKNCLLIGGEPTLYPNLFSLIRYLKLSGLNSRLITNGRLLADVKYCLSLKRAGLERVVISIEGSTEEVHNNITQTSSYSDTVTGITNCVKIGFPVSTLTTISTLNNDDLTKIAKLVFSLGVSSIGFNCAIPSVQTNGSVNSQFTPPLKETAKRIEKLYLDSQSMGVKININMTIPVCLIDKKIRVKMIKDGSISVGCQMYRGSGVAFDSKGNAMPCTHFVGFPILTDLNAGNKPMLNNFLDTWENGKEPAKFRDSLWRYPSDKCIKCKYWGVCTGGCPINWLAFKAEESL